MARSSTFQHRARTSTMLKRLTDITKKSLTTWRVHTPFDTTARSFGLVVTAQLNIMVYILLEPVKSECPCQQIYVLNHLPYVCPLCNVCIVMNLTSIFQHQEDRPLKLQRKLRKTREVEAHEDWNMSDLVMIILSCIILCSIAVTLAWLAKRRKLCHHQQLAGGCSRPLMPPGRAATNDTKQVAPGGGMWSVTSPPYL